MKPRPEIVMPIVFGGAVTVTALTNLVMSRGQAGAHAPSPWLWVGIVGMAVCIVVVAYNTPHVAPKKPSGAAPTSPPSATAAQPQLIQCSHCGRNVSVGARCSNCGANLGQFTADAR